MDLAATHTILPADVEGDLIRLVELLTPASQVLRELATCSDTTERLSRMGDWLYGNWYTQQPEDLANILSAIPPPNLRSALACSTSGSHRWQHGWVVLQADPNGTCLAGLKRVNRWLYPGQYANLARPGMPLAPGDALSVNALVSDVDEPTGFWVSQSANGMPDPPLLRLYFNVGWRRIGFVLSEVTSWLDDTATKYSLKYPIALDMTQRVDTLVVYLERSEWKTLEPAAINLAQQLGEHLRQATPPLSQRLGAGAACAEDPSADGSFGQSRCMALAPAALELMKIPAITHQQAIDMLSDALITASINPQRPWDVMPV